jgi:hypothetical protein
MRCVIDPCLELDHWRRSRRRPDSSRRARPRPVGERRGRVWGGWFSLHHDHIAPEARLDQPSSVELHATGAGELQWSVAEGALPSGLAPQSDRGPTATLSGTPTEPRLFPFQIVVADGRGGRPRETSRSPCDPRCRSTGSGCRQRMRESRTRRSSSLPEARPRAALEPGGG